MMTVVPSQRSRPTSAQKAWAAMPVANRLRVIRRFRRLLADHAVELASSVKANRAEALVGQVMPLADACRFHPKSTDGIFAAGPAEQIGNKMNIAYFRDADTLYIELLPETANHSWEAQPGININIAADGRVVGIEIEHAADRMDMSVLRVGNFPGIVHTAKGSTH